MRVTLDDLPSPWSLVWSRIVGGAQAYAELPRLSEILVRSMSLSGLDALNQAQAQADLVFTPRVEEYEILDFSVVAPIAAAGLEQARARIAEDRACATIIAELATS